MSSMQDPDPLRGDSFVGKRMRHGDDHDDIDVGSPRVIPEENASTAGMVSFIFAAVAIGLILVVAVLWIFLDQEDVQRRNVDRKRLMFYWFLFLDVLSFFAGLTATVFGARGLSQYNSLYRGWAMTGLTLGIIEMVATMIFFFIMTCVVLLFEVAN